MPEAVASNNIRTPEDQPPMADLDRFKETIHQIEALTLMLDAALSQGGGFHRDISSGIAGLFRGQVYDLEEIYADVKAAIVKLAGLSTYENALKRLDETLQVPADDKETQARLTALREAGEAGQLSMPPLPTSRTCS